MTEFNNLFTQFLKIHELALVSGYKLVPTYRCLWWRKRENDKGAVTLVLSIWSRFRVVAGDNWPCILRLTSHPWETAYDPSLAPTNAGTPLAPDAPGPMTCKKELMKKTISVTRGFCFFCRLTSACSRVMGSVFFQAGQPELIDTSL